MENLSERFKERANPRIQAIRFRTWSLTLAIVVSLVFYFMVQVITKRELSLIDFVLLFILQIVTYSIYFPDGDIFGTTNKTFITNKKAYNLRAAIINKNSLIAKLRDFCEYEYEKRKKAYIQTQCGFIGITVEELEDLKKEFQTKEKIKTLQKLELQDKKDPNKSRLVFFDKSKRKILYGLIFKEIPVERNQPETIMSAVEYSGVEAIRDGSIRYKNRAFIKKIASAILIGGLFAYIGFTVRDGFGIAEITSILMYLTTIFANAVMAYNAGEICSRVYKNQFYVELVNFIDEFLEWSGVIIDKEEEKE